jgi:hypothetical protein
MKKRGRQKCGHMKVHKKREVDSHVLIRLFIYMREKIMQWSHSTLLSYDGNNWHLLPD